IPASELVIHGGNGHCGPTCNATLAANMADAIARWAQYEVGGGGGGGSPLDVGTVGLLTFKQYPNFLYQAIGGLQTTTAFRDPAALDGAIENLSAKGDVGDVTGPSVNSYIAVAGEYCSALIAEVSGTAADKRGFNTITGLNNFNITPATYSDTMRRAVIQNFAQRFWGRMAADPAEMTPLLLQITETLAGLSTAQDTKNSAILTCTAIATSPRGLAN
ncbi:MAG TPA: hypothetical protein VM598_07020, partial [Bdellovibrionota bacterium]|nr:hypothetical protein [Bdellovibrionota bacterium]